MRECLQCKDPLEDTHRNRKFCDNPCRDKYRYAINGPRSTNEQRKEWYSIRMKKPEYREKLRKQGKKLYQKVQAFLRNYKIEHGCKDCGYSEHHAALSFDHILGEKKLNVCNSKSINQAKSEIEKCEVVCFNCHSIRTFERLQERKI